MKFFLLLLLQIFSLSCLFSQEINDLYSKNSYSNNYDINNNFIDKNIANGFKTPVNAAILNTVDDDFAPFFDTKKNELIFNSIYKKYSTYFVAKVDSFLNFSTPKILFSPLNESGQNRSYFTLIDEKQALVSAFNLTERGSFLNIQKSIFERNAWSAPNPISEFSDSFFIAHPTVSPNGEIVVFSTNKNEKNKNTDLWMAAKQPDGGWNMFIPIDELNSIGNEITPFFASDSLLIFASDGFEGPGGFDLFYSFYSAGKWSKPQPLEGINTEFNESDPAILTDGTLIFASDIPGGKGKLDLYFAKIILNKSVFSEIYFTVSATNYNLEVKKNITFDYLQTNSEILSKFTKKNDTALTVTPPAIQFFVEIDSNYKQNIDKYNYKIFSGNKILEENNFDFSQNNFIINFNNFFKNITVTDSFVVEISCQSNSENLIEKKQIVITVNEIETKELRKYKIGNEEYYKILTISAENIENYKKINSETIEQIKNLAENSKKINILCDSKDSQFLSELKKIFNLKQPINLLKTANSSNFDFIEVQIFI